MSVVQSRTITAYQALGNGRRWLTKAAAYNDAAKRMMRERCDHDREDGCFYCYESAVNDERWKRTRARLARWLRWRDERLAGVEPLTPRRADVRRYSAARLRAEAGDEDGPF